MDFLGFRASESSRVVRVGLFRVYGFGLVFQYLSREFRFRV